MSKRARDYYFEETGEIKFPHYSNSELVQLQKRGLDGDKEAWDALWLHGLRMVSKICKRLKTLGFIYQEDWDDAVQVGNLAIGEALPTWSNNQGRYSTYIWTCIRNAIVKFTTEQKRGGLTGAFDLDGLERRSIDMRFTQGRQDRLVTDTLGRVHEMPDVSVLDLESALGGLPERQAYIIEKYYLEDMSDPEISVLLGISKQAVGQQRNQALDALQLYFFG